MSMDALAVDKPWLMLGDCLERMKEIPDGRVDAVVCDLPYGMTACAWDSVIPLLPLWEQYRRVVKPNGAIVLTGIQPFSSALVMSNPNNFKYAWVWEKTAASGHLNARRRPMNAHEDVLIFGTKSYNPQMGEGKPYRWDSKGTKRDCYRSHADRPIVNSGVRYPRSVLKFANERGLHPTQKPVTLLEYLIRTYTNESETVLDNAAGSFSTGVACINTGRRFIGIEKDAAYFETGRRRIENAIAATQPAQPGGFFIAQAAE